MPFLCKSNALQAIFNCYQNIFINFLALKNDDTAKSNLVKISDHGQFERCGSKYTSFRESKLLNDSVS